MVGHPAAGDDLVESVLVHGLARNELAHVKARTDGAIAGVFLLSTVRAAHPAAVPARSLQVGTFDDAEACAGCAECAPQCGFAP